MRNRKESDHRTYMKHKHPKTKIGKLEIELDQLQRQLAEKDKEIERLKQCVMSREQVEAILRPEISNLTKQLTKEITPTIYKECCHQICEKIREFIEQPENSIFYDASLYVETEGLRRFLDQIEKEDK